MKDMQNKMLQKCPYVNPSEVAITREVRAAVWGSLVTMTTGSGLSQEH